MSWVKDKLKRIKPISKWQPKDWFLPAMAYNAVMPKQPKVPEYQPSGWETESYDWLKGIREGTSPLVQNENYYKLLKSKLMPEYQRLQKEYDIYSARRGIEGGGQQQFYRSMAENQTEKLRQAMMQIEEGRKRLQMSAGQTMTQLGSARSAVESQQAMAQFRADYEHYQQLQQALGDMIGTGLSLAVGNPAPIMASNYLTPNTGGGTAMFNANLNLPYNNYRNYYKPIGSR